MSGRWHDKLSTAIHPAPFVIFFPARPARQSLQSIMQSAGAKPEEDPFELFPYADPARMMQSQAALKEQRDKVLSLPAASTG